MPWCDDCSKFWNPPQLAAGANCPTCGQSLLGPAPATVPGPVSALPPAGQASGPAMATKAKGAPWHFKLLVVGVTGYMIYRIYWLIEWLPKHV